MEQKASQEVIANFWKTVKPIFNDKVKASTAISLVENDEIVADDAKIADIFNEYFIKLQEKLQLLKIRLYYQVLMQ